jgi:hypothetical protein
MRRPFGSLLAMKLFHGGQVNRGAVIVLAGFRQLWFSGHDPYWRFLDDNPPSAGHGRSSKGTENPDES